MTASTKGKTVTKRLEGKDAVEAAAREMIMMIPMADPDDGSGIMAAILEAESIEELQESVTKLPDAVAMVGKDIKIHGISRYESDIQGSLGWYLMCDYTDTRTGDVAKFQTSAASVMGKLLKLSQFKAFPVLVQITKADKATRGGFFPLDMEIIAFERNGTPGY